MERWKAILNKLLFPGRGWAALIVLAGGGSLALTFLVLGKDTPFAYVSYALSAYALTVFAAALVPLFSSAGQMIHSVPLAHRYMTDLYFNCGGRLQEGGGYRSRRLQADRGQVRECFPGGSGRR